jgi:putative ABC transport system permease protein
MNTITRGFRNAFRNVVRTTSIVVILGISIGLALTMLVARQAVQQKINSVQSSIGNTITIAPAGFSGFSSVNNSLTTTELAKVSSLAHVTNVAESVTDRLTTIGSTTPSFGGGGAGGGSSSTSTTNDQTSLTSPVTINTSTTGGRHFFVSGGGSLPTNFTPPVEIDGTNNPTTLDSTALKITSGSALSGTSDANDAMVSTSMASKNNLKVGSTFTAYGTTLTVTGIFSISNEAGEGTIIVSLPTEQRLSGQTGDVTSAVATVDSVSNLNSVTTTIKNTLGSSVADVTSSETEATTAIAPLNSIKNISLYSLIGAVIAGSVIILLTMIMIVRERRREIGVIKAIGSSNLRVIFQFMTEAVTLTLMGALIGLIIGVAGSGPVTKLLVNNASTTTTTTTTSAGGAARFGGGGAGGGGGGNFISRQFSTSGAFDIKNVHAVVGWDILLYSLLAAIIIAVVGSAIASGLIAKVRPAEVMRTE